MLVKHPCDLSFSLIMKVSYEMSHLYLAKDAKLLSATYILLIIKY